jgi:hypothetical protein
VAVEAINPGFAYPAQETSPGNENLFFHTSFFAKMNGKEQAGPVYLSFYWSDEHKIWVPNRLITDQWLGIETMF